MRQVYPNIVLCGAEEAFKHLDEQTYVRTDILSEGLFCQVGGNIYFTYFLFVNHPIITEIVLKSYPNYCTRAINHHSCLVAAP